MAGGSLAALLWRTATGFIAQRHVKREWVSPAHSCHRAHNSQRPVPPPVLPAFWWTVGTAHLHLEALKCLWCLWW